MKKILSLALGAILVGNILLPISNPYKTSVEINEIYASTSDGYFTYEELSDNEIAIKGYRASGSVVILTIPSEINGKKVTKIIADEETSDILNSSFSKCKNMITVDIPDTVTSIEKNAFKDCNSLSTVNLSDNLETIGSGAFYNCTNLNNISLPKGLKTIGSGAFYNCIRLVNISLPKELKTIESSAFFNSQIESIKIPDGITSISEYTFASCKNLSDVIIPESVTSIGDNAFMMCNSLVSIDIPDSVIDLGKDVFNGCSRLSNVTLPKYITEIPDGMFHECPLKNINIPNGVTSIGSWAFQDCNIKEFIIPDSITSIGTCSFSSDNLETITIPKSVIDIGNQAVGRNTKILCYKNSIAHSFAATYSYSYQIIQDYSDPEKRILELEEEIKILTEENENLSSSARNIFDINGDGEVNIADLLAFRDYLLK